MVIYGGMICTENVPQKKKKLRWEYCKKRESKPHFIREKSPFNYFRTNNFLIKREIMQKVKFDERIVGYGHEDTFFAYMLMKNGFRVRHIDNPVLHSCTESNSVFLKKTEKSIHNLIKVLGFTDYDKEFIETIRVLQVYAKIKKLRFAGVAGLVFRILKPGFKFFLSYMGGNLWLFDIYKLGLLTQGRVYFNKKMNLPDTKSH